MARPTPPVVADFELICCIGAGSYGEVWLARSVVGRLRAVKIVHRDTFRDGRPFEREFSGIQKYEPVSRSHESLVNIFHVGRNDVEGYFYYVMELADNALAAGSAVDVTKVDAAILAGGELLPEATVSYVPRTLAADAAERGRIPAADCLRLAIALSNALVHLHQNGLIHRDIKPSNVIFVRGIPKLADIGLVTEAGESCSFVGTEGFVPPEGPGQPQADLYSLGKVLYEIATGRDRLEFPKLPPGWGDWPDHRELLELNEIILKACESDPARRYQTAGQLLADLALLQSGRSIRGARKMEARLARITWAAGLGLVVACISLTASFLERRRVHEVEAEQQRESGLRARAERAEQDAKKRLAESLVARARAERRSGLRGRRSDTLEALRLAATLGAPILDLHSEIAATLALPSLDAERRFPIPEPSGALPQFCWQEGLERCAVGDLDGSVRVVRGADGVEERRLIGPGPGVTVVGPFSPDGTRLIVRYAQGEVWLWDLSEGRTSARLSAGETEFGHEFTRDSRQVAALRRDGTLRYYEAAGGVMVGEWPLGFAGTGFWFCPDGRHVAVHDVQQKVIVVAESGRREILAKYLLASDEPLQDLAWSPDSRAFAVWFQGRTDAWVYEIGNPDAPALKLSGHESQVVAVAFDPNRRFMATSSWDNTIRLWDAHSGEPLLVEAGWALNLAFSKDGAWLGARVTSRQEAVFWRVSRGEVRQALHHSGPAQISSHNAGPTHGGFSSDGRLFSAVLREDTRVWWGDFSGLPHSVPSGGGMVLFLPDALLTTGQGRLRRWTFHADPAQPMVLGQPVELQPSDRFLWLAGTDKSEVFFASEGEKVWRFDRTGARVLFQEPWLPQLFSSPSGRWLLTGGWHLDQRRLYDGESGQRQREWTQPGTGSAAFTVDDAVMFVSDARKVVKRRVSDGAELWSVPNKAGSDIGGAVACTRDGTVVATALDTRELALLDGASGTLLTRLESPDQQPITWLTFSPDGRRLAVCGSRGVNIWDLQLLREEIVRHNLQPMTW